MTKYILTCDNGQILEMELIDPNASVENEIKKLEELFVKLIPEEGQPHPSGWNEPLPTKIISFVLKQ